MITGATATTSASASAHRKELVLTRIFDAPRALVFRMWTEAEHVALWWGPQGFTNPVCEVDARPGGVLRIVMRAPNGALHPMKGVFREVVAPELLVFTNIAVDAAGDTLLEGLTTVIFAEEGGKTRLTLKTYAAGTAAIVTGMLEGMEAGWSQSLDKLVKRLNAAG